MRHFFLFLFFFWRFKKPLNRFSISLKSPKLKIAFLDSAVYFSKKVKVWNLVLFLISCDLFFFSFYSPRKTRSCIASCFYFFLILVFFFFFFFFMN
jgi:hypothetical protein